LSEFGRLQSQVRHKGFAEITGIVEAALAADLPHIQTGRPEKRDGLLDPALSQIFERRDCFVFTEQPAEIFARDAAMIGDFPKRHWLRCTLLHEQLGFAYDGS